MKSNLVHTVRITIIVAFVLTLIFFFKKFAFTTKPFQFIQSIDGIEEYRLEKNSLKVLLMEDHSAPVVTTMVTYLAGQREELHHPEEVAHLLEHMVMKSTANYNQAKGRTAANALQEIGAMMNATTEPDITYYYETFPSEHVELALNIQADRMRHTLFHDEDVIKEREVVRNELERLANDETTLLTDRIWKTAYKVHPYRHSIIGYRERARRLSANDLKNFYNDYYWPNNAVLTVIGNFDKRIILEIIKKEFESIPKSPKPIPTFDAQEPKQTKPRLVRMTTKEAGERIVMAFKSPSAIHQDSCALDLLVKILTSGKKSRMYQLFVDQKASIGTGVDFSNSKDPGLFSVWVQLAPEIEHRRVGKLVLKLLEEIKRKGVSESELNRAKKQIKSEMAFAQDGSFSIASYVTQAIGFGDWTAYPHYLDQINRVTSGDIQRAAKTYLIRENLTVGLLKSSQVSNRKPIELRWPNFYKESQNFDKPSGSLTIRNDKQTDSLSERSLGKNPTLLSERIKVTEEDGVKILSYPTSLKNIVMVDGSFEGAGRSFSSNNLLAGMVADMLDKGTLDHDKYQLAERLENLGASISFSTDYKRFKFRASALKEDIPETVELLREILTTPSFPEEELETMKSQNAESIKAKLTDPMQMAYGEFKRSLYSMSHPNFELAPYDQLDQLNKITIEDIKKFYADHYHFQNFKVIVSGDVDGQVLDVVKKSLPQSNSKFAQMPYDGKTHPLPSQERKIFLEGKKSIEIFLGHTLPLHQKDKDYAPALLSNFVLGGNFSARLLTRVREEKGLTYAIHSQFAGISNDLEGHWVTDLIAVPEFANQALSETKKEIKLWVEQGVTEAELMRNKRTIIGSHKVGLATTEGATRQILSAEEMELGVGYLDEFPKLIDSVTLEDANRVIKQYFKPEQISVAVAGEYPRE